MPILSLRCPHCHSLVELEAMDTARSPEGEWRVCPACDEALLFRSQDRTPGSAPRAPSNAASAAALP